MYALVLRLRSGSHKLEQTHALQAGECLTCSYGCPRALTVTGCGHFTMTGQIYTPLFMAAK